MELKSLLGLPPLTQQLIQNILFTTNTAYWNQGKDSVVNNIIKNYFSGNTIVIDENIYGPGITDYCLLPNIDPQIFSQVKYFSEEWAGSATGNYPATAKTECHTWIQDDVTGKILATGGSYGRRPNNTLPNQSIDISKEWINTVSLYGTATWEKPTYDATGTSRIGNIQLTIR